MAFNMIRQTEDGVPIYECLSTDTKETPQPLGAEAYETDTGDKYEYRGSVGWKQTDNAGSIILQAAGTSTWSYGSWPQDRYDDSTATAGDALDNTVFGTLTNQGIYAGIIFIPTANECTMQISLDGTTFIAADHPFIDMGVAARTIVTTTTANTGPFLMNTPCKGIRFLNDGAAAATVTYSQVGKVDI